MSDEKLRAAIEEIRAELASAEGLSEGLRRSLTELADSLQSRLDQPGPPADAGPLRRELSDWVRELEALHPKLATTIESVIDTLALFNL